MMIVFLLLIAFAASQPITRHMALRMQLSNEDRLMGFIICHMLDDPSASEQSLFERISSAIPNNQLVRPLIDRLMSIADSTDSNICPRVTPLSADAIWRQTRVSIASRNLQNYRNDASVLNRIIAIDEFWIVNGELQMIAAFARDQIIAHAYLPNEVTTNSGHFTFFLTNVLRPALARLNIHEPIIIMDNLSVHNTAEVRQVIRGFGWQTWEQPPRSQDIMPLDIEVFPDLRQAINDIEFASPNVVRQAMNQIINNLNNQRRWSSIEMLPTLWQRVIDNEGDRIDSVCIMRHGRNQNN